MIRPGESRLLSPYFLTDAQSGVFWAWESEITQNLWDYHGITFEFSIPAGSDEKVVQVMCQHLSDFGWCALFDDTQNTLIVYPRKVWEKR